MRKMDQCTGISLRAEKQKQRAEEKRQPMRKWVGSEESILGQKNKSGEQRFKRSKTKQKKGKHKENCGIACH